MIVCLDCWLNTTPPGDIAGCPCCLENHRDGHAK